MVLNMKIYESMKIYFFFSSKYNFKIVFLILYCDLIIF